MDKDICIKKICSLPLDFKKLDKSASILVNESQFIIFQKEITPMDVENYLTEHLELIKEWEVWSDIKRTSKGLYLSLTDKSYLVGYVDKNGKTLFENSFYSRAEACTVFILSETTEILHTDYELQFDVLMNASIEIGNRMNGIRLQESQIIYFAEGLSQKIINHTLTARYLINGYQPHDSNYLYKPMVDFASIIVLTRAALETYLALNYVFIAEGNEELREFRFKCWDLAGYIERENIKAKEIEHIELKESERIAMEILRNELQENSIFKALSKSDKNKALNGGWRLSYYWHNLATKAGFSEDFFKQEYKILCSYAHASRLSVIQIQQNKTFQQQKEMALPRIAILTIILAKHMYDYIEIMPQLNSIKNDLTKYPIILYWKNFGDMLQQPEPNETEVQ